MHVNELFDISGKTAIVTGGGRGIGEMIAEGFAEAGANIVVCSRREENCKEVSERLKGQYSIKTLALKCDVTNPEDIKNVVGKTVEEFGGIDILVNNSGATWGAPVDDMPIEAFQKVMNVNVLGTFLMSQAVGKVMTNQKSGKIINIASVAGLKGTKGMDTIGYNSSKGAVITFTKDLAVKWGERGIYVNAIAPGFFPTKMTKVFIERRKNSIGSGTPIQKIGLPDDIKGVALLLASNASNYITGETIVVDGGSNAM